MLLYLRQRLREVIRIQQGMMEARISREMEKKRSILAKAGGAQMGVGPGLGDFSASASTGGLGGGGMSSAHGLAADEEEKRAGGGLRHDITEEQRQMFEEGNQVMLKQMQN